MNDYHIGTPVNKRKKSFFISFMVVAHAKKQVSTHPQVSILAMVCICTHSHCMTSTQFYIIYTIICMYVHMPSIISGVHHGAMNINTPHVMKVCNNNLTDYCIFHPLSHFYIWSSIM